MIIRVKSETPINSEKPLRQDPVVHYVKDFNEDGGKLLAESLSKAVSLGQPFLPIIVDSYGGQCYSLLSMIGIIESSPIPIATIVSGKAMSCGAMLAAMGTRGWRYISPSAHILLHHVFSHASGIIPQVKEDVKQSELLDEQIFSMVDKNCGQKKGFFLEGLKPREGADWYIKPDEALALGLVDHVRMPVFSVNIKVEMGLS